MCFEAKPTVEELADNTAADTAGEAIAGHFLDVPKRLEVAFKGTGT